ncbi:hypothetical protein [Microbacterium karelineae]|uniref:hypothetical protein n=1 Tax=Microbacterium karelineae TaxID=2654283 RepID=UPI0012EA636C|nr:hypothetical protein [Microbacterium karelineae]
MAIRRITCKGGPLHGKRYDVPVGLGEFRAEGGTYKITEKQGTWNADDEKAPAKASE